MSAWTTLVRRTTALFVVVAIALAAILFSVKAAVQGLADRADALEAAVLSERRAIHVLRAEWTHLNDPDRLRRLARLHLDLQPIRPDQVASFYALVPPVEAEIEAEGPLAESDPRIPLAGPPRSTAEPARSAAYRRSDQ